MELSQSSIAQISGIKRWSNIVNIEATHNQYILEHISSNGSQIAILNYDESNDKHQPIAYKQIHDKFGKYLKMCKINKNGNIVICVVNDGNIIKWNINNDIDEIISSVPIHFELNDNKRHKINEYQYIKISQCGKSLLVDLKDRKHENINNIWIYNENVEKWFNTHYKKEIDDGFKSYKYYNNSWYIIDIGSDTSMSYEINVSIHKLSVIINDDDQISESLNEDIIVSIECIISIDLSQYNQYLTNKIHKILWDLPNKLIILLFDEFIIWISIENKVNKSIYCISLIPSNLNIKFRDMIFLLNKMIVGVVTNNGSLLIYQRLSEIPIPFNYHENNKNQNIFNINWKKLSNLHFNNSFKLHSMNDSKFFISNGHTLIHYKMDNFKLKYFASNPLAFIRSNRYISHQMDKEEIINNESSIILQILCFGIQQILISNTSIDDLIKSFLWMIDFGNAKKLKNNILEEMFFFIIKCNILKPENVLKIIKICNKYFKWISKCIEIEINKFYDEIEKIVVNKTIDILKFNLNDLFCFNHKNKLYYIIILILFENASKIITNDKIDKLIDILWRIYKLNQIYNEYDDSSSINILSSYMIQLIIKISKYQK